MRSMTGFGQAQADNGRYSVAVTLRSVNGKFLDLVVRLRDEYRAAEAPARDLLAGELARGRVEAGLEIRPLAVGKVVVEVRKDVVRALHQASASLIAEGLVGAELTLGDLLRIPEAVEVRAAEADWQPADLDLVLSVIRLALAELVSARVLEGAKLRAALLERLAALEGLAERLEPLVPAAQQEAAEALRRRIQTLLGTVPVDEQRLAQEVAVQADRADVREELDRLKVHLQHFREVVDQPGAVGKRLDFLVQEIFRELNTLGAKCRHPEVTRLLLDAKTLGEQIREQAQNVE